MRNKLIFSSMFCLTLGVLLYAQITPGRNGGGGGGTPANPLTSIQFNNAGAFGGSANLEWDNTNKILTSDSYQSAATDTGPLLAGTPVKLLLRTASGNTGGWGQINATAGSGYSLFLFVADDGLGIMNGGTTAGNIKMLMVPDVYAPFPDWQSSISFTGDLLDWNGPGADQLGRANVAWKGVWARFLSSDQELNLTSASGTGAGGFNVNVTAGDADTGFNGGHIIGHAGGSSTGTDAGRIEFRGGDSTNTARGGDILLVAGLGGGGAGSTGGNASLSGGNATGGGNAGGDLTLQTGIGSGGATNGKMFFLGLPSTGAATKKVLCIDTGTGQLFMSTSDTQCLN